MARIKRWFAVLFGGEEPQRPAYILPANCNDKIGLRPLVNPHCKPPRGSVRDIGGGRNASR